MYLLRVVMVYFFEYTIPYSFLCIYISYKFIFPLYCTQLSNIILCIVLLLQWLDSFFNTQINDSLTSVGVPLFFDMLLGFVIHLASTFSRRSAYSVRTLIDYVTVYRAHSSQSIRKKGVTPLSVPSLSMHHYFIYSRPIIQSPGDIPLSVGFKMSVSAVRTEYRAEVYTLAFCTCFSAKCNFDAIALTSVRAHGRCRKDSNGIRFKQT